MARQKWVTVLVHRSYKIQVNQLVDPVSKQGFGYRIDDPAFLPDYKRYNTVDAAVKAIDEKTK